MLRYIGILPAIFLGLLPCVPGGNPALANHVGSSGVNPENLVQIQICTTPGQVKYLVLNLVTGEMFEETIELSGSIQHHQKCGHSLCQGVEFSAEIHSLSGQLLAASPSPTARTPEKSSTRNWFAVARAPPAKLPTNQWA